MVGFIDYQSDVVDATDDQRLRDAADQGARKRRSLCDERVVIDTDRAVVGIEPLRAATARDREMAGAK